MRRGGRVHRGHRAGARARRVVRGRRRPTPRSRRRGAPTKKFITRSLPGLSEARTAALAKPRTAAAPVDIDDGRPTVTVGFESSGDFYWLPMVRLLEAALPGVRLRLADPTYDWSAVSLFLFPCLFLFPSLFLFPYVYGQFN